tara:strand:- start:944 stop:1441 length:498 start_codon:yes stop_codon:yes gene_type:complete
MLLAVREKWQAAVEQAAVVKITVMVLQELEIITTLAAQILLHHPMGGVEMVEMDLRQDMVDQTMLEEAAVVPVVMELPVVVQEINMDLVEMVLNIRQQTELLHTTLLAVVVAVKQVKVETEEIVLVDLDMVTNLLHQALLLLHQFMEFITLVVVEEQLEKVPQML